MKMITLMAFVMLCLGAAGIGGFLTSRSVTTWYPTIARPAWNPPNAVFGPVWTALYLMMAVAAWIVWEQAPAGARQGPLTLFAVQLLLNVGWSALFFGLRRPDLAFGEILVLWVFILLTLLSFWPVSRLAGALLVPYWLWVSFAAYLNFTIWRLNPL